MEDLIAAATAATAATAVYASSDLKMTVLAVVLENTRDCATVDVSTILIRYDSSLVHSLP